MAKKNKKRKSKKKLKKQLQFELLGLLFIFLSIFSSGASVISDGFIPSSLENLFKLFLGIWYFLLSIYLLISGVYLVVKRKFPTFYTKFSVGMLIFFLGMLLFTHIQTFDRLLVDPNDTSILKASWNHYIHYVQGDGVTSQLGGGLVGAILFAITYYLFSFAVAKIVVIFSLIIVILFITNLSLGNIYNVMKQTIQKWYQTLRSKWEQSKKSRENKESKEETQSLETSVIPKEEVEASEELDVQYSFDEQTGQASLNIEDTENPPVEEMEEIDETYEMNGGDDNEYVLPGIELLDETVKQSQHREKSAIQKTVRVLEETFESFGVNAKITKAHVGPAVTKYEVQPEAGVKVSRVLNLQDDIA